MAKLLYLVHRLPYPPNKGDKVRSYNLLKHLAQRHQIYLGTFIDDPADAAYLDTVRTCVRGYVYCPSCHPLLAKLRSLSGLLSGEALSLPYYRDRGLRDWISSTRAREPIDGAVIFSSVMADYIPDMDQLPTLVDFVDMDSAKWTQYAATHRWPLSWIYQREGRQLLRFERDVARRARCSFFVTEAEVTLFQQAARLNVQTVSKRCAMGWMPIFFHRIMPLLRLIPQAKYLSSLPARWITGRISMPPFGLPQRYCLRFADTIQRCVFISSGAARMRLFKRWRQILPQALRGHWHGR
jgi:hypothetical protein